MVAERLSKANIVIDASGIGQVKRAAVLLLLLLIVCAAAALRLPRLDVREMDLHAGNATGLDGIAQRHTGVRVGRRVDHNAVHLAGAMANARHERAFVVALLADDLDPQAACARPNGIGGLIFNAF